MTLEAFFKKNQLNPKAMNLNALDVQADSTFQRFDAFNKKYNPFGNSELRTIFLKTDNYMKGKYFAELTKSYFEDIEKEKVIKTELRVSIYGK